MWWKCILVNLIQLVWMPLNSLLKIGMKSKYSSAIYLKWLNLLWVTIILSFLIKFTNRIGECYWYEIRSLHPPAYACIYMGREETEFLKTQNVKPLLWLRYIEDIFLIWTNKFSHKCLCSRTCTNIFTIVHLIQIILKSQ